MDQAVDPQTFEREWWGTCANTFGEEAKQLTYAHLMGLVNEPQDGRWPVYDLEGKSVLDLGGGPVSMLLKCVSGDLKTVVDPCQLPDWVEDRYDEAGIDRWVQKAETFVSRRSYDECWIYNVLQHVKDPEAVIATARKHADTLRIFEWLETPASPGHPHTLHADKLDSWIGGQGHVGHINENGAVGLAYWGVFDLGE